MLENIALVTMALITVVILKLHEDERRRWEIVRREMLDRIQSVDYVSFKTVAKPKDKVEKEKPKPPDLV